MEKVSFETLTAGESGRFLMTKSGRHEVKASVVKARDGLVYLSVRTWAGSHASPGSTSGWSEPSRCSHVILDDELNIVAVGHGKRDKDSWTMASKALAVKGIDVTTVDPPHEHGAQHVHAEYQGRGNGTLIAWLKYWLNAERSQDEAEAIGTTREQEVAQLRDELTRRGVDSSRIPAEQDDQA